MIHQGQIRKDRQGIEQMVRHHREWVSNRGQVVGPVPLRKQSKIPKEYFGCARRQGKPELRWPLIERCAGRHARFFSGLPNPLFRWTSRSEIAAGVIPEMRAAWPIVSGRCQLSFCWTSAERPRTSR